MDKFYFERKTAECLDQCLLASVDNVLYIRHMNLKLFSPV